MFNKFFSTSLTVGGMLGLWGGLKQGTFERKYQDGDFKENPYQDSGNIEIHPQTISGAIDGLKIGLAIGGGIGMIGAIIS
jgi:hypothetical protein